MDGNRLPGGLVVAGVGAGLGYLLGRGAAGPAPGELLIPDWALPLLARLEVAAESIPRQNLTAQTYKVVQNIAWPNSLFYERSVINFAITGDLFAHPVVVLARITDPAQGGAVVEYNACLTFMGDWEAYIWYGGQLVLAQARGTMRGICLWIRPDYSLEHSSGG